MSTEVIAVTTQDFLLQEHSEEWKINQLSCFKGRGVRIPVSPIPNINVKFGFVVMYRKFSRDKYNDEISSLKVDFMKLFSSEIQPSLKLEFEVTVNYADGTLFQQCKCLSGISVKEMKSIRCIGDIRPLYKNDGMRITYTRHYDCMQSDTLILKLRMRLFGHLSTPSIYRHEMRSPNNLKEFVKDFIALLKPSTPKDITIRIEGRDLPVHKAILAAHSSVFMKIMENDFLESNTNIITISDFKYDIVECFLKYLYSGEVEDKSWPNVKELYFLADRYEVPTLKRECAEIIASFLTVDTACEILMIAYDYNDRYLKAEAKDFAARHFYKIVHKVAFDALVASNPTIVDDFQYLIGLFCSKKCFEK